MANYGLKYRAKAYGLSPIEWRVDFEEKNYTPAVNEVPVLLNLVGDGIRIGYDKSDDRFELIYSRYIELTIKTKSNFNIDTLQYDDERKYKIKVYKGDVLEFVGWLIPNYPSQEFEDDSISTFSLMAKDSINQLKNFIFKNEQPQQVTRLRPLTDIIAQTLTSIDLGLNFEVFYNKFDTEMSKTINDCPLKQTSVDINSFKKSDGTFLNNYEVLFRVLATHDLKIFQTNGKWVICSQIELIDGSVSGRIYNYLGVKQSNITINTNLGFHLTGLKVLSNTQIRKESPVQQVSALFELGDNENLLINGELDSFQNGLPLNWTLSDGWQSYEIEQNEGGGIIIKDTYATIPTYAGSAERLEDVKVIPVKNIRSEQINVQGLNSFNLEAEVYADDGIDIIRIRIAVFGITTVKFVDTYGEITNTSSSIYVEKGTTNASKLISVPFVFENDPNFAPQTIQISIFPGIRLRSGVPLNTKVKYKNIILTGSSTLKVKDYRGRKWEYNNTNLPTSKKQETITVFYEDNDVNNGQSSNRKNANKLYFNNTRVGTSAWKRTTETTQRLLIESILIDRLAITGAYGNIIEGSLFGYVSIIDTPSLDGVNRFMVLSAEYNLKNNETEIVLIELKNTANTISKVVYDVFEDDKLIEVSSLNSETEVVKVDESFDKPITTKGGIIHGILYPDGGIDSLPKDTTNPRAGNKGILIFGGTNAEEITLGNKENQTLVDVLGGKIKVGYGLLYDKSITDGDGDIVKQLGVDSDFQVDGRIEAASGISVGSDGILITKELGAGGQPFGQVDSQNELRFVSPVVNVTNVLGVNQITGINGAGVAVNAPFTFNQPIYILPSSNANSPITNAQFDTALSSYDFGNIRIYGSVDAASNGSNITLSGLYTLDGVGLQVGLKVLVKDQTDLKQNYIYLADVGAWSRVTDLPNNSIKGVQVQVLGGGTVNKGGIFVNTNTTDVTIGTTNVTFRQFFQNVLGFNSASLIANNQIFSGTNKFTNKLEVRTPLTDTEAVNMSYVTGQFNIFGSSISTNYWSKISNYGIGTITSNSLQFYVNNVKKAELLTNGMLTGLRAIHINDNVFSMPFLTSFPNYYRATIQGNVNVGPLSSGFVNALYSVDLIRGGTAGYRSGVRFGTYNTGGEVNQFYYGIEYSTADKLSIGRYSTIFMDGASTSLDAAKTTTVDSSGNWAFGKNVAQYRIDVNGDVNISGMFRINGSFGANHTFLKSNGTTQEFAPITVAEIADIATYYQAKMSATENYLIKKTTTNFGDSQIFDNGTFLAVGGTTAIDSSKFNVIGKIGATTARIGDNTNGINIGNLAIFSTGALGYNATSHAWSIATVEKLNLNSSRLALTGNLNVSGDVDITGKFKLNGSFGADHTFLKSNGTTQEFSLMTVGEIADIDTVYASKTFTASNYATKQDAVLYGTFDGERGFKLFHDTAKLDTAALFFANQDTGIVGIHYFGLDNSNNVTQHGVHIDGDGFVYHKKLNGSRARFLTTDDSLSGGGTSYSFAEPLYLNGNQVNVKVASASQNGVLTKEDWSKFNAAVAWNGGYVTNDIQLGADVDLLWGSVLPPTISNYGARIAWKTDTPQLNTMNFGSGVKGMLIETTYTSDGMYIGTQGDMKLKAGKYFIENKEIDMSGFATGKVLKATSETKAEWVTP